MFVSQRYGFFFGLPALTMAHPAGSALIRDSRVCRGYRSGWTFIAAYQASARQFRRRLKDVMEYQKDARI